MAMTTLQWPDYVILVGFLVISLGIGFYHSVTGGRQRTTQEFIMANRKLGILPTAMSLFVSFQSAILIIGSTAEMYLFGVQFMIWGIGAYTVAIVLAERLMIPWIYPLKLVSINDYLERRFESKAVRVLGAICGILGGIMYMGVAMYAPSAALESATGLPMTVSIPLMAVISVAYTSLGGMRAVIWTDVFQFAILIGGMLAILIKGLIVVGGVQSVVDMCHRDGRLQAANWSLDPTERHTVWGFMIGFALQWFMIYGVQQASVQRYSATESIVKARITLLINIPALMLLYVVVCTIGLIVFTYYSSIQCDPIIHQGINPNQLLSLFVTTIFSDSPGFAGLFLATLYGGALSSVSSSLSGTAANCWDDILKLKLNKMSEQKKAFLNRMLVVIFGCFATGIAFVCVTIPGPIIQISITFGSAVAGPIYGVYLMGGVSRHANWKGALAGGIGSICINVWLNVGATQLHRPLPILPYASTAGCVSSSYAINGMTSTNMTTAFSDVIYERATTSIFANYDNYTTVDSLSNRNEQLIGIENFYGLSYIWYCFFSVISSNIIGLIVSFIFRDRNAEARVESSLLIPFNKFFTWNDIADDQIDEDAMFNNNDNVKMCDWKLEDIHVELVNTNDVQDPLMNH